MKVAENKIAAQQRALKRAIQKLILYPLAMKLLDGHLSRLRNGERKFAHSSPAIKSKPQPMAKVWSSKQSSLRGDNKFCWRI
jgi:hypothetical protein